MNRGTLEGNIQEIELVKLYNKKAPENYNFFNLYNSQFDNLNNIFLCRVVTKQYSNLSNQKVMTRADAYAIEILNDSDYVYIIDNDYYIDENFLVEHNVAHKKILNSGISIKLHNSNKYQILKLTPASFGKLFGNTELGAGASLFCQKENELYKNDALLKGWLTSEDKMCNYYNIQKNFTLEMVTCRTVKHLAEVKIKEIINNSTRLQDMIFKGVFLYEEPYSAHYIYKNNNLEKLEYIPFQVTTGSGRSKGVYTIVLKPI